MTPLRVAFVVQGEGRGHMTQALALGAFLRDAGHEVVRVMLGESPHRRVPDYFAAGMACPVHTFEAPTQVAGADRQGLSISGTVIDAVRRSPAFIRAIREIGAKTADVDVVVNFLDLMGGLSRLTSSHAPAVAVAHNYLFLHPDLAGAPGPDPVRRVVLAYARATATGTTRKLALSFAPMASSNADLEVMPPLLRPGLDELTPTNGDYLLAYALNPGYANRLAEWHRSHPEVPVRCYVEGGTESLTTEPGPGFDAHDLDGGAFLNHLAGCRAFVGSAGFEAICEAHYLGKPVLAVPTEGQFEQTLNAWDAERCGTARTGSYDDLTSFWGDPQPPSPDAVLEFRSWVSRAPELFVEAIEGVADRRGTPHAARGGR